MFYSKEMYGNDDLKCFLLRMTNRRRMTVIESRPKLSLDEKKKDKETINWTITKYINFEYMEKMHQ